jgi:hypothetical protein
MSIRNVVLLAGLALAIAPDAALAKHGHCRWPHGSCSSNHHHHSGGGHSPTPTPTPTAVVESDPAAPQDQTGICVSPVRVRNMTHQTVTVRVQLTYAGEGPGGCQVGPYSQGVVAHTLGAQASDHLGYAQCHHSGSFCVEKRSWSIVP